MVAVQSGGIGQHIAGLTPNTIAIGLKVHACPHSILKRRYGLISLSVYVAIRALLYSRDNPSQAVDWLVSPTIRIHSRSKLHYILCDHYKHRLQYLFILFRALSMPSCIGILVTGG